MCFMALEPPFGLSKPCQVCVSHKPNSDGYLYKTWAIDGRKRREPFHRFVLRAHSGWETWPVGLECDHLCGNRLCAEPSHLRPLQVSDHKSLTNTLRYAERNEEAFCHWLATGCTGTSLAERYGVTVSTGCRWVRQFKDDPLAA